MSSVSLTLGFDFSGCSFCDCCVLSISRWLKANLNIKYHCFFNAQNQRHSELQPTCFMPTPTTGPFYSSPFVLLPDHDVSAGFSSGFLRTITKPSRMGVSDSYSSVASCARSPKPSSTGVLFVTKPVMVLGLPVRKEGWGVGSKFEVLAIDKIKRSMLPRKPCRSDQNSPAWPTTSTAWPTRTDTLRGLRSSSKVLRMRGDMAKHKWYSK